MKKLLTLTYLFALMNSSNAQAPFTITNNTGTYSLTCVVDSISLSASTQVFGNITYHWAGPAYTHTGSTVMLYTPGSYTVMALDSTSVVFGTQYFSIGINTVNPVSSVNPAIQNIACNTAVGAPVSASGSGNVTHMFLSPYGGSVIINAAVGSYTPLGTGTYTHVLLDNVNGCTSSSTFTLVSAQAFPTFSITSPQNFTLGCNTKSVASINIANANTTNTPGGPISYTLMPLSENNPAPPGILSPFTVYTVTVPGLYYVIVKDNTTMCNTQIPITIIQNTVAPNINVSANIQVLDCTNSQAQLTGTSTTSFVTYNWSPGNVMSNSLTVASIPATPTQSLIGNYTLTVTDNNNTCTSTSVIPVYQNIFSPNALISNPAFPLSCASPTLLLYNQSTSTIPPFFTPTAPVVGLEWYGPAPQASLGLSSTYTAAIAGTYTLVVKDLNNGCISAKTTEVSGGCNLVGIQENKNSNYTLSLFPNPNAGVFTLRSTELQKNSRVEVYNSIGMLVKQQTITSEETILNIEKEAIGIYIVHVIQNKDLIYTSKFVKE